MKKLFVLMAVALFATFTLKAQVSDISGYYAQTLNLQEHVYTSSQVESMFALPGQQSSAYGYKDDPAWMVGKGLLIGGGVCFGVVGVSYVVLACTTKLDDLFANMLIVAWTSVVVGSAGAGMMIVGGILMGVAKNNYAAATFDLGDGPSYAQLGLTRTGNVGLTLTF